MSLAPTSSHTECSQQDHRIASAGTPGQQLEARQVSARGHLYLVPLEDLHHHHRTNASL